MAGSFIPCSPSATTGLPDRSTAIILPGLRPGVKGLVQPLGFEVLDRNGICRQRSVGHTIWAQRYCRGLCRPIRDGCQEVLELPSMNLLARDEQHATSRTS